MCSLGIDASEYFVAGGTLPLSAPSYIPRPADEELFMLAQAGKLCYILTPRQMGKSSLMVRAAQRLRETGARAITVDLTEIGEQVTPEQWYFGLLTRFARRLRLAVDLDAWWQAHSGVGCVQRFTDFLRDVVVAEIPERIVIFIDEIDTTLKLAFRDDFFAALRALHNARAEEPALNRLTFVLLGVASPPDLIRDRARTPFNVGESIVLQEFSRADAAALEAGLEAAFPGQGAALFARIYHWTGGHPYLTQKLCYEAAKAPVPVSGTGMIDALVQTHFLSEAARSESNLQYVQDLLLQHPQCDALLRLYRRTLRGNVPDDVQNPLHNILKLSGLVKAENGILCVRNEVYHRVFTLTWVQGHLHLPTNWTKVALVGLGVVALFAVGLIVWSVWADNRVGRLCNEFGQMDAQQRLHTLAQIFRQKNPLNLHGYSYKAYDLFFGLSCLEQVALFDSDMPEADLKKVITDLYKTLANVEKIDTTLLLQKMYDALPPESEDTRELRSKLDAWLLAREQVESGQMEPALERYRRTADQDYENPAIWYEKAYVHLALNQIPEALDDLERVLVLANESNVPTPESTVTPLPILATTSTLSPVVASMLTPMHQLGTSFPVPSATTEIFPSITQTFTSSSAPTAMLECTPVLSQFRDLWQIRRAIKALITRYPAAEVALSEAGIEQYPYLCEAGLGVTQTIEETPQNTLPNPVSRSIGEVEILFGRTDEGDEFTVQALDIEPNTQVSVKLQDGERVLAAETVLADANGSISVELGPLKETLALERVEVIVSSGEAEKRVTYVLPTF